MNVKEMSIPMPKNGKPMTEQEYIQTCTTEQLAEVFMQFMFDAKFKRKFVYGNFYDEFAKWLKQPHTTKE